GWHYEGSDLISVDPTHAWSRWSQEQRPVAWFCGRKFYGKFAVFCIGKFQSSAAQQRPEPIWRPAAQLLMRPLFFAQRERKQIIERFANATAIRRFEVPSLDADVLAQSRQTHESR